MKKIIFWETILVLATVPIFRALWMLLDSINWLNEPKGIFVSFAIALIAAIWAFARINAK